MILRQTDGKGPASFTGTRESLKISVLRANGLGDFLFALPALQSLRSAYPSAEITLLGLPWHREFLRDRPSPVDRILTIPVIRGIREEAGQAEDTGVTASFLNRLQQERFDFAIQMHGGGRFSNPFTLAMGARLSVGLRSPDAAPLDLWVPYIYFQPEILRYLEVVSLLGAKAMVLEPRVAVTDGDLSESRTVVKETDEPFVVIVPGAGDGRRRWPAQKFAVVADLMVSAGARVYVIGLEQERPVVEDVLDHMKHEAGNLCGRLTINGLTGLLSRSCLVIGNDSGPLHLAKAVGTRSVGIYWCGNLITAEPITRHAHRPVLSWRLECPTCGANCIYSWCDHHDSFVADVAAEEVYDQAMALFPIDGQR